MSSIDRNKIMRRISTDLNPTEVGFIDGVTAGTAAANKAVVLDASSKIDTLDITTLVLGGTTVTASAGELNLKCDNSAETATYTSAGAISSSIRMAHLALSGTGAMTLGAPANSTENSVLNIEMTADNGDVTLDLTNVVGQSSGTTATFNDVGDALILIGLTGKWLVLKEHGITLS